MKKSIIFFLFMFLLLGACREKVDTRESMEVGHFVQKIQTTLTSGMVGSGLLSNDVRDILVNEEGEVFIATAKGVCSTFDGGGWHPYLHEGGDNSIIALTRDREGNLWAGVSGEIKRLEGQTWTAFSFTQTGLLGSLTTILGSGKGGIWVGTDQGFAYFDGSNFEPKGEMSTTSFVEDRKGNLWRGSDVGLYLYDSTGSIVDIFTAQNGLISSKVRALSLDREGKVMAGTDKGISVFDTKSSTWTQITGTTGLPFTDISRISFTPQGELLVGTTWGAAHRAADRWHYFAGKRWVPNDLITGVAMGPDGTIWLGTGQGIGRVARIPMTLEEKAAHYKEITRARHNRMGMFTGISLNAPGDLDHFRRNDDDNDGLWTQMYIAAESFRYAVTKDPEAKKNARESFEAMLRLEQFPRELGNPGFHARSIVTIDELLAQQPTCSTFTQPTEICACKWQEWMTSSKKWKKWLPDVTGKFCFKGDTSSDEIDGHMFGYSVYYDLAAETEEEKNEVRGVVFRLMNHIVDHGYQLWDMDGTPTTFGRWDPDKINSEILRVKIDGKWQDAGSYWMDALEILSFLRAAYHITGEKKFYDHYRLLIEKYGYDTKAAHWQYPYLIDPRFYNYSDDELAFLAYYPLLQYERGPVLGKLFVDSVEGARKIKDPQRNPLWNFIAGSRMERGYGLEGAVRTLKEYPWSLIEWRMLNSQRTDITIGLTEDRHNQGTVLQSTEVLPYDERVVEKWNSNPYELDGGWGGYGEEAGTPWLLPYWMGRYHGFIKE